MPAKSESQRKAAAVAYQKKCKKPKKTPKSGPARKMAKNMSCKQLKDYRKKKG